MTDQSFVMAALSVVANANANATVAAAAGDTNNSLAVSRSLISFLRMEADLSEERAKRLRKQAATIAEQFGITEESQQAYDLDPTELPPLDENGIPKYKGKKRGRKPKVRKRKMKADRPKRKHTGYTLFMQEKYPNVKTEHTDLPNKDLISLVAKQWKDLNAEEKTTWKERAQGNDQQQNDGKKHRSENDDENIDDEDEDDGIEDDDVDEDDIDDENDEIEDKKAAGIINL